MQSGSEGLSALQIDGATRGVPPLYFQIRQSWCGGADGESSGEDPWLGLQLNSGLSEAQRQPFSFPLETDDHTFQGRVDSHSASQL